MHGLVMPSRLARGASLLSVALFLLGGLSSPIMAQVLNSAPAEQPAEGERATGESGPTQSIDIFGDWSLQCVSRSGTEDCFAETRLRQSDAEGQSRDLVIIRIRNLEEGFQASLQVPSGVLLTVPAVFVVGGVDTAAVYQVCGQTRCLAQVTLSEEVLTGIAESEAMEVGFSVPGPRNVRVPVSLNGLAAVLQSL